MEVRKGYKKTELGIIPEDWDLVPFDRIFNFHSTSNYSKAQMSENDEVGCIHYGLIHATTNSQYNLKNGIKYYITSEQAKYELVRDGDVIMVDASEDLEGINKSVEVFGVDDKKFISGLHTYLLRDKNSSLADNFRGIILNSKLVKNQMLQLAVGMKVFGVSKTQLIKVKLPLPPTLKEQKAIADALSNADELIEALDKLIVKKEAIKKGAMQELLTGKRRLPGFSGEWKEKRLGDVVLYRNGSAHEALVVSSGKYVIVNSKFISTNGEVKKYSNLNINPVNSDEILMVLSDVPNGKAIAKCYYVSTDGRYTLNQRICSMSSKKENNKFLYFLIDRNEYFLEFDDGVKQTNLRNEDVLNCPISIPTDVREQEAIAEVLTDMDEQIDKLKIKREKAKQIKEGMMQELLTGKTRLV